MKVALYCRCGAVLRGTLADRPGSWHIIGVWEQAHSGEGHGPTDAKGAARARRQEDDRHEREERA